ncbi:1-phosphatidylinositol phosphodiesterase [Madurella mycetomatis]|uniref:1-phosphatidylinositol phosphodiesterase n=1 Tax=Madurella mycetomatis TaxID=100816 RepID=A0A175W1C0_9PEZI|nr:1-phosphatidylinositol phosphodiesterase [Madurella mycetomatis]
MGSAFSCPVAGPTQGIAATVTIRNLTVTPLELKLAERLDHENYLSKITSRITGRRRPHEAGWTGEQQEEQQLASARQDITDITVPPFSECPTSVHAPDLKRRHEQLRLTFEDPSTGHRYSAEIPGPSPRSIVLKPVASASSEDPKEFTAIYLPSHSYLALFSSANLSSWMSTLPDHLPLSSLSIPGTHNSPTHHTALPSVRCQAVPVIDQLNNGVRFLDVRVSCPQHPRTRPSLQLVHSAFPITINLFTARSKSLSALLDTLYTFLAAHPTETLLLSLKREGTGKGSDADLSQILLRHYIDADRDKWYTSPAIPRLSECRGRIVLVRRFQLHKPVRALGIDGSVWPDNAADGMCRGGAIRIQDFYDVARSEDMERKLRYVQEGLERAAQMVHPLGAPSGGAKNGGGVARTTKVQPLYINFLSASSFFNISCWPDRIAVKLNPSTITYLCMEHGAPGKGPGKLTIGDAATGIVVTDWVGHKGDWDLMRCIVGWNARLQLGQ